MDYEIDRVDIVEGEIVDPVEGWQQARDAALEIKASFRSYQWSAVLSILAFCLWAGLIGWWTEQWAPLSTLAILAVGGRVALWWGYHQNVALVNQMLNRGQFDSQTSSRFAGMIGYPLLAGWLWFCSLPVALWLFIAVAINCSIWQAWVVALSGIVLTFGIRLLLARYRSKLRGLGQALFGPKS